jgi:hypothetical protein
LYLNTNFGLLFSSSAASLAKYSHCSISFSVGTSNIWTYLSWTDWLVVEFSWFSMQPKQSWYLYITWIVNSISDNGINWVCSYEKDWTTDNSLCKEARFEFKKDLKISKSASSKEGSVWSVVDYTITIQNNGC